MYCRRRSSSASGGGPSPRSSAARQVALDALGELLLLGADHLEARLPPLPLALTARVRAHERRRRATTRRRSRPPPREPAARSRASSLWRVYPRRLQSYSGRVARILRLLLAAAAAALATPALAHAEERTLTFTTPAISVEAYGVAQQPMLAESPKLDGYVVGMEAEVVDAPGACPGTRQGDAAPHRLREGRRPRLHVRRRRRALLRRGRGAARALAAARLRLREQGDRPLGPPLHADEPQAAAAERLHPLHGALRHRRDADAGEAGLARRPQLHRPRPGLRRPRRRQDVLDLHEDGRLHDAARAAGSSPAAATSTAAASGSSCATRPAGRSRSSRARPGAARSRSRSCTSPARRRCPRSARPTGIPVAKGDRLRLAAVYDNSAPHTRAMGIMLLFLAPGAVERLRRDAGARHRSRPALRAARLLDAAAARAEGQGLARDVDRASATSATAPSASCSSAAQPSRGASWAPSSTTSPSSAAPSASRRRGRRRGVFKHRFTKAGTYRLFCSLHPAKMVQQITVR